MRKYAVAKDIRSILGTVCICLMLLTNAGAAGLDDKLAGTEVLDCEGGLKLKVDTYLSIKTGLTSKQVVHFPDGHSETLNKVTMGGPYVEASNARYSLMCYNEEIELTFKGSSKKHQKSIRCK